MTRRLAALAALVLLVAALAAGCDSRADVAVEMDRTGRGNVTLAVTMDAASLGTLRLSADDLPGISARLQPMLDDTGWYAPQVDGAEVVDNVFAVTTDDAGGVTFRTRKDFDNVQALDRIMDHPRTLRSIAGEDAAGQAVYAGLPDLPLSSPLLNDFTLRLGSGTGDNPGFDLFARGGVGDIGEQTCQGDRAAGFSRVLRDSLDLRYRFALPGGPGETNADETPEGRNVWNLRYEDCDALQAESGGGSSSTLVNGVILAALAAFLVLVFALRALRRRRARRAVPPPAA